MQDNQTEAKAHPITQSLYGAGICKTQREINELKALEAGIGYSSDKTIALYLGAGRSTIWKWVRDGLLPPPIKITRSHSRWSNQKLLPILIELAKGVSDDQA